MQDCRHDCLVIHAHLGEDVGSGDRVGDIGFPGETTLAIMCLGAEQERIIDPVDLFRLQVFIEQPAQITDAIDAVSDSCRWCGFQLSGGGGYAQRFTLPGSVPQE